MSEIASLPLFHRVAGNRVLVLGEGMAAEPKRRLVERAGGEVITDMARAVDAGVRIAFIALEEARACEAAAIDCHRAGMLVNVVDRPELCDFTMPSILDRDPVLIAIGTGGASAGLAKHLRLRLERILPATLGRLARALFDARGALRERLPDAGERRRALDAALCENGALDPLDPAAHERVAHWAAKGAFAAQAGGTIAFDVTSADPDDLTLRQARLLGEADAVCVVGAVPPAILARARADAQRLTCDVEECRVSRGAEAREGEPRRPRCLHADRGGATGLTLALRWRPDADTDNPVASTR